MTWRAIANLRTNLLLNARRVLGPQASQSASTTFGKAVLGNFYDFICEIALGGKGPQARIAEVVGRERYLQARSLKRGAILVTAHLGAFEAGVAALRQDESRVHVVFRRDPMKRFERLRAAQRERLGVIEAAVDDGLAVWMNLRDALLNDEVVLMQGDRVMPGQSGLRVPFLNGHIIVPRGPVKLAMITGAPLIPIFAPRMPDGSIRIVLEESIDLYAGRSSDRASDQAVVSLAAVLERAVRNHPEQWLVLHRAFCEDQATPDSSSPIAPPRE